jgi:cyclopropane fatty-acyl-phospholipid synthase-like methyltransferase
MKRPPADRWWDAYFDEALVRLYRPFLPEERTWAEVEGLVEALDLAPGARVLDLACGWGRHAVELARLGLEVCGLDRSEALLRHGARLADAAGVEVRWVRGDVRDLPWSGCFDAVVSLFSSLGYFLDDEEDRRALRAARRALKPGGAFLLETMHRDSIAREFAERDWWTGEADEHVWVEREFDAVGGVSHEWLRWTTPAGEVVEKYHAIRVRAAPEWDRLLRAEALRPDAWYGSWDLDPFELRSGKLIVVSRRGV